MLRTVRTSQTVWRSAESFDDFSHEGERDRFDELAFVSDINLPVMSGQGCDNVLMFELPADEVFGAVELDAATSADLADPGDQAAGNGQRRLALVVEVGIEGKAFGQVTERWLEPVPENAREAGSVLVRGEAPAGLLEVIVVQEAFAGPSQGPQIGAAMPKDSGLPGVVEALHSGVPARFSRRDEDKVDAQEEMKPDDLGDAVAIPAPSGGRHLIVHLGDLRTTHNTPGINEMREQGDRSLVQVLVGRDCLAGDIDGVEGIEPGDAGRAPQVPGADHVGLLEISHFPGSGIGIRRSAVRPTELGLLGPSRSGQDLLDRRDGGKPTETSLIELMMDRLGADAGKSRPPGLMGLQFVPKSQDRLDERFSSPVPDMLGGPASVPKPFQAEGLISARPLGQPEASSLDFPEDVFKADSFAKKPDRLASPFIFELALHRPALLPLGIGGSLGDAKSVCDVLTV